MILLVFLGQGSVYAPTTFHAYIVLTVTSKVKVKKTACELAQLGILKLQGQDRIWETNVSYVSSLYLCPVDTFSVKCQRYDKLTIFIYI